MATRAALDASIDAKIGDKTAANSIDPATDDAYNRKEMMDYVDAHPAENVITDTQSTINVLTKANNDFNYTAKFWRNGSTIYATFYFRETNSGGSTTARDIATIADAWKPASPDHYFVAIDSGGNTVGISVQADKIHLDDTLTNENDHMVTLCYPALN